MKLCLFCKYFYFEPGCADWSDITPGDDAEMGCTKFVWELDMHSDTTETYRKKILTAEKCVEYNRMEIE